MTCAIVGRWRSAYNQTVTAVLEDVRVFRVAKRIRGSHAEGIHLIEVCNHSCEFGTTVWRWAVSYMAQGVGDIVYQGVTSSEA